MSGNIVMEKLIKAKKHNQLKAFMALSENVIEKARRMSLQAKKTNCSKFPSISSKARYGQYEKLLKNIDHLC